MKKRLVRILYITSVACLIFFVAVGTIWVLLLGYSRSWTGFGNFTMPDGASVRGKTLWDWMDLFIIPIFLALGAFYLNRSERITEGKRAEERAKLEREIATDIQHEDALQSYLDRMAELLLKENLLNSDNKVVHNVARIRTLTLVEGLDARRKRTVLLFLKESGLLDKNKTIIDLKGANLSRADLIKSDLQNINLGGTNLQYAQLQGAELTGICLQEADLRGANLSYVDEDSFFFDSTRLVDADLRFAKLAYANLRTADLTNANLSGTDLRYADVTYEELKTAKNPTSALIPDSLKEELAEFLNLKR